MPGPAPKREAERRRRNRDGTEVLTVDLSKTLAAEVEIPAPPTTLNVETGEIEAVWHPIAETMYRSLMESGQAIFYEPSDWALAYALCETLSRELNPQPVVMTDAEGATTIKMVLQPVKGATLNAFLKGMGTSLMAAEGDRRKVRIELDRQKQREAATAGGAQVIPIAQQREDVFRGAR